MVGLVFKRINGFIKVWQAVIFSMATLAVVKRIGWLCHGDIKKVYCVGMSNE